MATYIITAVTLILWLVLCWFVPVWMHLQGASVWILRISLWVLGLVGAGTVMWFKWKSSQTTTLDLDAAIGDELDHRIAEALKALRTATRSSRGFGDFPLVLVLGESGSGKSSVLKNSGLDPDLLSGLVDQDGMVVPTRSANFFYAQQTVFVDVGGPLLAQPGGLLRLVKRLQPGKISSAVKKAGQAPRSVVLCFDTEAFLQRRTEQIGASARALNAALRQLSQYLGSNFAVYVLFTRADRLGANQLPEGFFTQYVRNFTREEGTQVLGATVTARTSGAGVYAEEETRRLSKYFDEFIVSLAEKRVEFLGRENDTNRMGAIYEFPRELNKLRTAMVQFMVDVCRPGQMPTNPFLRGFFFCGVRPLMVSERADLAPDLIAPATSAPARGATVMFGVQAAAPARAQRPLAGTVRVPQWAFVTHLLTDVVLKDRAAMAASGSSTRVNFMRRLLLGAAIALVVALATCITISFFQNRALEESVHRAAAAIGTQPIAAGQMPAMSDLQNLDGLRQELVTLRQYEREGAPLMMRFGLYAGDRVLPPARAIYFARFRPMLFATTQQHLVDALAALPATASGPNPPEYDATYDTLKAYLITTTNPDKSTSQFLAPVLLTHYRAAHPGIDDDHARLTLAQFAFYGDELRIANPYAGNAQQGSVDHGRQYLKLFAGPTRIYNSIISAANAKNPEINFGWNVFPDARDVVVDPVRIPGAFTKAGFATVNSQITNLKQTLAGERWVLGEEAGAVADIPGMQDQLRKQYLDDYANRWRDFMAHAVLRDFSIGRLDDAVAKLTRLSLPNSPMLELVSTVSDNTIFDPLNAAFQPAQKVVTPGAINNFIQPGNQSYVGKLVDVRAAVEQVKNSPQGLKDQAAVAGANGQITQGSAAVLVLAGGFTGQPAVSNSLRAFLDSPFKQTQRALSGASVGEANGAAAAFCQSYSTLMRKRPFNQGANDEATLDEFNSVFAPGKGIWALYQGQLQNSLMRSPAGGYVANPTGSPHLRPEFVAFFNAVAAFSESLYPANSPDPKFNYTLRQLPNNPAGLTTFIDGRTANGAGGSAPFEWPGTREGVKVNTGSFAMPPYTGVWGVFDFMSNPELKHTVVSAGLVQLDLPIRIGGRLADTIHYQLEMAHPNVFFNRPGAACVARAVQ